MNIRNYGIATGRVTRDLIVNTNKDGSRKVFMTLAVQDNFVNREGKKETQFISFEAFISSKNATNGVYDCIHKGDKITVQYTVKTGSYDKNGETVYTTTLVPESIDLLEDKSVTDARAKKNAENAANADVEPANTDATCATNDDNEELPYPTN